MLTCPDPPPVTVIVDPGDDLVHTRAALAAHDPSAGRITVHPTPGTDSTLALAHDVLAALGKPVPVAGYRGHDTGPAWALAAAWILATGTTHLLLLRAHFLTEPRLDALLLLRRRTGLRLTLVVHTSRLPAGVDRILSGVSHHFADATALLPAVADGPSAADCALPRPLANRWIALPALTTLLAFDEPTRPCRCSAPLAPDRDFFPPVIPQTTQAEVAWRLHRAAVHPHLAAELATAVFTAASTTQLRTAHVHDLGPAAATITLHDDGLRRGCMTHEVPLWARPLLMAARRVWDIVTGTSGPLFTDPLGSTGLPSRTVFAEWEFSLRCPGRFSFGDRGLGGIHRGLQVLGAIELGMGSCSEWTGSEDQLVNGRELPGQRGGCYLGQSTTNETAPPCDSHASETPMSTYTVLHDPQGRIEAELPSTAQPTSAWPRPCWRSWARPACPLLVDCR